MLAAGTGADAVDERDDPLHTALAGAPLHGESTTHGYSTSCNLVVLGPTNMFIEVQRYVHRTIE